MSDMLNKKRKGTIRETIVSVLIAVAFLFNAICLLANILVPSLSGFGELFIVGILFAGVIMFFVPPVRLNIGVFRLSVLLIIIMLLSYIHYGFPSVILTLMVNYVAWGIGVTVIIMQDFKMKKIIDFSFALSTVIIVADLFTNSQENYESMVWTYAVFPCLAAVLVHFVFCRFHGFFLKLLYIPGLLLLFKFVINANRGGMVSLILLFYFLSIKKVNFKNSSIRNRQILNILFLVTAVFAILFYEQIIDFLYNLSVDLDMKISALKKMHRMIASDNITNNRDELYAYAWNGFLKSPLWGNGVGGFSVNHGGWAHNFILQILYEGGIMLFLLIMVPIVRITLFFVNGTKATTEEYSLFVLFFCTSIPRLLFSTELWNTQSFWMLFAFGMLTMHKYKGLT